MKQVTGKQEMKKRYGIDCVGYRDGILVKGQDLLKQGLNEIIVGEEGLEIYIKDVPVKLSLVSAGSGLNFVTVQLLFTCARYIETAFKGSGKELGLNKTQKDALKGQLMELEVKMQMTKDIWAAIAMKKEEMKDAYLKVYYDEIHLLCPLFEIPDFTFDWLLLKKEILRMYKILLQQTEDCYREMGAFYRWVKSKGLNPEKVTQKDINKFRQEAGH